MTADSPAGAALDATTAPAEPTAPAAPAGVGVPDLPQPPSARDLARAVRASHTLSAGLKRHWLQVLPHLHADDRRRLAAILRES